MQKQSGFTIVEMAVVVFVIGLLVAGVMSGKNLLAGSQGRAVISEMEEYQGAMRMFQQKYFDWPGDITNATELWPTDGTRDGDGNERVEWDNMEGVLMWKHLELAKMIGQTGFTNVATANAVVGQNVPGSKIAGAGWFVNWDATMKNFIGIGAQNTNGMNIVPALSAKRAYDIDVKIDDANPALGMVQSDGAGCVDAGGTYATSDESPNCVMRFSLEQK